VVTRPRNLKGKKVLLDTKAAQNQNPPNCRVVATVDVRGGGRAKNSGLPQTSCRFCIETARSIDGIGPQTKSGEGEREREPGLQTHSR